MAKKRTSIPTQGQTPAEPHKRLLRPSNAERPEWSLFGSILGRDVVPATTDKAAAAQMKDLLAEVMATTATYRDLVVRSASGKLDRFSSEFPTTNLDEVIPFLMGRLWVQTPDGTVHSEASKPLASWDPAKGGLIPRIRAYAHHALFGRQGLAPEMRGTLANTSLDALQDSGRELTSEGRFVSTVDVIDSDREPDETLVEERVEDVLGDLEEEQTVHEEAGKLARIGELFSATPRELSSSQRPDLVALLLCMDREPADARTLLEERDIAGLMRQVAAEAIETYAYDHEDYDDMVVAIEEWKPLSQSLSSYLPDVAAAILDGYRSARITAEVTPEVAQEEMTLTLMGNRRLALTQIEADLLAQEGVTKKSLLSTRSNGEPGLDPMRPDYLLLCLLHGQAPNPRLKGHAMLAELGRLAALTTEKGISDLAGQNAQDFFGALKHIRDWNPETSYWHEHCMREVFQTRTQRQIETRAERRAAEVTQEMLFDLPDNPPGTVGQGASPTS